MNREAVIVGVDTSQLSDALQRLATETKRDLGDIVRQVTRLLAGNLMHAAQPYGATLAARKTGEGAVMRDVGKVFMGASAAYKEIQVADKKLASAWYKAVKAGEFAKAEKMIEKSTLPFRNARLSKEVLKAVHKKYRGQDGTVNRQSPAMIISDPKALKEYAKKASQKVGFGKAGWITAASSIGGASMGRLGKIPAWVTRHKGTAPGGANDKSRGDDPFVTITNQVRYASDIRGLSDEEAKAERMVHSKMIAYVEYVLAGNARKAGFQARTTQPAESPPK